MRIKIERMTWVEMREEVLSYLWTVEGEQATVLELIANLPQGTEHIVRRALLSLEDEGLVSRQGGEVVSQAQELRDRCNTFTGSLASRQRFRHSVEENRWVSHKPVIWTLTEKGVHRMMES